MNDKLPIPDWIVVGGVYQTTGRWHHGAHVMRTEEPCSSGPGFYAKTILVLEKRYVKLYSSKPQPYVALRVMSESGEMGWWLCAASDLSLRVWQQHFKRVKPARRDKKSNEQPIQQQGVI